MEKERIKKSLSSVGRGTYNVLSSMSNVKIRSRMAEIDAEIERLQEERAELEDRLIDRI